MDGKGHAITTLLVGILVGKYLIAHGVEQFLSTLFVFGAFLTCHSADVWGISAISPDADIHIGRIIGKNIHRKWYFHSFLLSLPLFWAGAYFFNINAQLSAFLFGTAFGWNAHIVEDDIWSRLKGTRKKPFPLWVELTSLMMLGLSVLGVLATASPQYLLLFEKLYYTVGLGFIPANFGFPLTLPSSG